MRQYNFIRIGLSLTILLGICTVAIATIAAMKIELGAIRGFSASKRLGGNCVNSHSIIQPMFFGKHWSYLPRQVCDERGNWEPPQ